MSFANFADQNSRQQDLMQSAVNHADKNICRNIDAEKKQSHGVNKAIGVYGKDCLLDTVENVYAVVKQNLNSWRLIM